GFCSGLVSATDKNYTQFWGMFQIGGLFSTVTVHTRILRSFRQLRAPLYGINELNFCDKESR
ncbi:hypothetical protein ACFFHP_17445, partial [Glutamicibacter ardleyensis]|uniref:hypothetical protein n=1 Tax=Glutamicibacter ardleyensis TaxID=225894 RepID=UPI0035EE5974